MTGPAGAPAFALPPEPIEIERYQRRWRFVVEDLRAAGGQRWMWEGPDGLVDARPYRAGHPRNDVVDALHFWIHDWSFFRGTRRFEHGGREWTARRSSRVDTAARASGVAAADPDAPGIYFSAGGAIRFLPIEVAGPDFATLPVHHLRGLLERAVERGE